MGTYFHFRGVPVFHWVILPDELASAKSKRKLLALHACLKRILASYSLLLFFQNDFSRGLNSVLYTTDSKINITFSPVLLFSIKRPV